MENIEKLDFAATQFSDQRIWKTKVRYIEEVLTIDK